MAKAPSFQFYPGDWLRDAKLRACSLPARGLWIDMVCIMHQGEPYGHLTLTGAPVDATMLARMVGTTARETAKLLAELENAGVFSRTESGVVYSRRMVSDEQVRRARAAGGSLGGNPALKDKHKVDGKVNIHANLQPTPSSSSPFSSSPSTSIDGDGDGAKEILLLREDARVRERARRIAAYVPSVEADDRTLIAKVAILWDAGEFSDDDVEQVLESLRVATKPIADRPAWFYRCMSNRCDQRGKNFQQLLKLTAVPVSLLIPPGVAQ